MGRTIAGTPCDDTIVVPPWVLSVDGGGGDDVIRAAPLAADASCPAECRLGVGSQTFQGGPGDDVVFGERGNDRLEGGEGNDRLYGGIGDDLLLGGPGNDRLAGGFGADTIDGEAGDDHVRGDGTIDHIFDRGGGFDTLSYATGVTPSAFGGAIAPGFPGPDGERGVRIDLGAGGQNANNGIAALGGGVDEVEAASFEVIVGTAFSDYIFGAGAGQTVYGGGGADVLEGAGPLIGGADGDNVDGAVVARDTSKASVGLMVPAEAGAAQIYLVGGSGGEAIAATYTGSPPSVSFAISGASFDTSAGAQSGCATTATTATCALTAAPDSVLIAGMGGDDEVDASGFPATTSVVVTGGEGGDELTGGEASEDVLVDGPGDGADVLEALGRDDALLHNGGADTLAGGERQRPLPLGLDLRRRDDRRRRRPRQLLLGAAPKRRRRRPPRSRPRRRAGPGRRAAVPGRAGPARLAELDRGPRGLKRRRRQRRQRRLLRRRAAPTSCSATAAPTSTTPAAAGTRSWPTRATRTR